MSTRVDGGETMDNRYPDDPLPQVAACVVLVAVIILVVCVFTPACRGDLRNYYTMDELDFSFDWLLRELDGVAVDVRALRDDLAEAREEVAGLKGWIAGIVGVPLAGGSGIWALRWHGKKKRGGKS